MSAHEQIRAAYARATIAHETAARAAYRAELAGGRGVGLAKAREARAWARLCAARATFARTVTP